MKRIISLGLAALILLGTITGVLISAVYALGTGDPPPSGSSSSSGSSSKPNDTSKPEDNKGVLTNDGILIEKYYRVYNETNKTTSLVLVLVDTNIKGNGSASEFQEFYLSLLTSNFYPLSNSDNKFEESIEIGRAHV